MLAHQAWLGAISADALNAEGLAGDGREGERGPKDLSAAFTLSAVDGDEL